MKFSELTRLEHVGVRRTYGPSDADISDVHYDSRQVSSGSLFVAIKGFAVDGHAFVADAIRRGATAIILEDDSTLDSLAVSNPTILFASVDDSRRALAYIAEAYFGYPSRAMRLIGVTGTNGKTTVTHLLKQLLAQRGECVGLIGTIGIWMGDETIEATHTTPESRDLSAYFRAMVDAGVTTCVMEVSSHALALGRVAALDYDIAVFTNLTQDHLDFHKTMEAYFVAKQLLFSNLKDTAVAITNIDSPYGLAIAEDSVSNVHSYGVRGSDQAPHADIVAEQITYSTEGTQFALVKRYSDESAQVDTRLIGSFNVENILAAASALYFGVEGCSLAWLATALKTVQPVPGRLQSILLPTGVTAVVDYAHTPDALEHVLETLGKLRAPQSKLIVVFGCGGNRDAGKRPMMGEIAARLADRVVVTNDNPRNEVPQTIAEQILAGISENDRQKYSVELDRTRAIESALTMANAGDTVLIAGKGHENYQIIGEERLHFDDAEVVHRWARTQG